MDPRFGLRPEGGHLWDNWLSMTLKLHKSVNSVFILSFCFDSGSIVVMLALDFMEGIDTEHFVSKTSSSSS